MSDVKVSLWRHGAYEVRVRGPRGVTPLAGRVRVVPPIGLPREYVAEDAQGAPLQEFPVDGADWRARRAAIWTVVDAYRDRACSA